MAAMSTADPAGPVLDTETLSAIVVSEGRPPTVPGLTVLWHTDLDRVGERVAFTELACAGEVELSRTTPRFRAPGSSERRPLADPHISRRPLRLVRTAGGDLELRRAASGTETILDGRPLGAVQRVESARLQRGAVLVLGGCACLLLHELQPTPPPALPRHDLVGDSTALAVLRAQVERLTEVEAPVLLRGATGTGKELVARAVHAVSRRRAARFVSVNMGAVPAELAAGELFGAAKGAFTGAVRPRSGYFQHAHGGSLFLDEIGETPPEVQALLLRVLEDGEVQPLGDVRPRRVDARLIAATDADLERAVAERRFRAPLLHRLGGYVIHLPPLRDRLDDLGRLLAHFLRRELSDVGAASRLRPGDDAHPWLAAAAVARLADHDWPGNVRELRNVARRLALEAHDLATVPMSLIDELTIASNADSDQASRPRYRPVDAVPEDEIVAQLAAHDWRILPAAKALGMSRTSLYKRVETSPRLTTAAQLGKREVAVAFTRAGGDLDRMVAELRVSRPALRRRLRELGIG